MTLRFPEVLFYAFVNSKVCRTDIQKPTPNERDAINSYFHLTSRLYPCGECATEFQALLKKFPPQVCPTSHSRETNLSPASDIIPAGSISMVFAIFTIRPSGLWIMTTPRLCSVHNEINQRLKKPEFDCAYLDDEYDCGCGDPPTKDTPTETDPMDLEHDQSKDDITGAGLIKGG